MELEAALQGTRAVQLNNVPHRARELLQEFVVNGPEKPTTEHEGAPLQPGALSRVVRVRFESPALDCGAWKRLCRGGETSKVAGAAGPLGAAGADGGPDAGVAG